MTRKLTISSSYRKRIWKKPILSPKITISGKWLQELGFEIGDKINVQTINNQLIITKS